MQVLYVLFGAGILWSLVATVSATLNEPYEVAAASLATMLVFTGMAHFGPTRGDLARMVPPGLPSPMTWVMFTGILELLGAVALLFDKTRSAAGAGLAGLFVALFPANIHAAREGQGLRGKPPTPLIPRALMQALFVGLSIWVALS